MQSEAPSAGQSEPVKGLPPVEPPSGKFIAQLFLIPFLIVASLFLFGYLVLRWAGSGWSQQDYLNKLDDPNLDVRWRGAEYLSQTLLRDDNLASNPKFALDLAERLRRALDSNALAENDLLDSLRRQSKPDLERDGSALDPCRDHVLYLSACLGNFAIPIGAPLLSKMAVSREGADPKVIARKRWRALWALANLGDNLKRFHNVIPARQDTAFAELEAEAAGDGERGQWARATLDYLRGSRAGQLHGLGVDKALLQCAEDGDPFMREIAAFALNFWEGDAAEKIRIEDALVKLSRDDGRGEDLLAQLRDEDKKGDEAITKSPGLKIRYNATIALARRGSDKVRIGVLREMMDGKIQQQNFRLKPKNRDEMPDEPTARTTQVTALQAATELHRKKPNLDLSALATILDELSHDENLTLRTEARRTRDALAGK